MWVEAHLDLDLLRLSVADGVCNCFLADVKKLSFHFGRTFPRCACDSQVEANRIVCSDARAELTERRREVARFEPWRTQIPDRPTGLSDVGFHMVSDPNEL